MLPRRRTPSLGFTAGRRTTRPRPARGLSEALAREVAGDQGVDERRFGVETVARLWPDARGRAVDDLVGDLLAALGGAAGGGEEGCPPRRASPRVGGPQRRCRARARNPAAWRPAARSRRARRPGSANGRRCRRPRGRGRGY